MNNIIPGLLVAVAWIVGFGAFFAIAAALEHEPPSAYDRWFVRPVAILWVFGGGIALFLTVGLGWFH